MAECENNTGGITLGLIYGILKKHKRLMILSLILAGIISTAVINFFPQVYHSRCIMLTEEQSYVNEGMKMVGSIQGVNVGNINTAQEGVYTVFYPELLSDPRMLTYILSSQVKTAEGVAMPYGQHIRKGKSSIRPEEIDALRPTLLKDSLKRVLQKKIKMKADRKTLVITIDVKDEDAFVACTMCDSIERYIAHTISEYRKERLKTKIDRLQLVEKDLAERTRKAFDAYTTYADEHQQASLPSIAKHTDELFDEAENLKKLTEAVRLERFNATARLNDRTPPYIIIQRPNVPSRKQGLDAVFTIFTAIFTTLLFMLLCFLARPIYEQIKA